MEFNNGGRLGSRIRKGNKIYVCTLLVIIISTLISAPSPSLLPLLPTNFQGKAFFREHPYNLSSSVARCRTKYLRLLLEVSKSPRLVRFQHLWKTCPYWFRHWTPPVQFTSLLDMQSGHAGDTFLEWVSLINSHVDIHWVNRSSPFAKSHDFQINGARFINEANFFYAYAPPLEAHRQENVEYGFPVVSGSVTIATQAFISKPAWHRSREMSFVPSVWYAHKKDIDLTPQSERDMMTWT